MSAPHAYTRYLLLTGAHTTAEGGRIWLAPGSRFEGRVHTNTTLAFWGSPHFGDSVSSVDARAWFHNRGMPKILAADHNDTIDVPVFERGFHRGAAAVPLPEHAFDQQAMALGITPGGGEPAPQAIRAALGLPISGNPPPNGIYVVQAYGAVAGGIYVQGDASRIVATADPIGGLQAYQLTTEGAVATITVDPLAGTTTVNRGGPPTVLVGTPNGVMFVNGAVADLRGPDRVEDLPPPALLGGQGLLIAATGDIVLQGDLTVEDFDQGGAVIGLFSCGGSVRIGTAAPTDMRLDAFVLAIGAASAFIADGAYGPPRGVFHLRGGVVASFHGAFAGLNADGSVGHGYARDFQHDSRGLEPPGWPTVPPQVVTVARAPAERPGQLLRSDPNPVRGALGVRYSLRRAGRARLSLLDLQGRRVVTLADADQPAGEHFSSHRLESGRGGEIRPGHYLLLLESGGERAMARVVILAAGGS